MLCFIQYQFGIPLLIKTFYKFVTRIPQIKAVNGIKMESDRVQCNPDLIEYFYNQLEEILLTGILSAFVINIDESGYCDWVNKHLKYVFFIL